MANKTHVIFLPQVLHVQEAVSLSNMQGADQRADGKIRSTPRYLNRFPRKMFFSYVKPFSMSVSPLFFLFARISNLKLKISICMILKKSKFADLADVSPQDQEE